MSNESPDQPAAPSRRWKLWAALAVLQLLLMGSAFVGGRMVGQQNARRAGAAQLPSQLPKEELAGSGTVQKIQDNVITLSQGEFGGGGAPGGQGAPGAPGAQGGPGGQGGGGGTSSGATSSQTDVSVSADTKYYKSTSSGGGGPGDTQTQVEVSDATLADVKIGNTLLVWGTKSGSRITASVVYIQSGGF
jgi:hypothetical protein